MACNAAHMWSFSGLMAAFLDLTIAYLLLCGSAVAYLASKLLGFFGFSLPCPCDGVFINVHSRNLCFNRLLVDFPIQKLSGVEQSVRNKFPFSNFISPRKYVCSVEDDDCAYGDLERDGEASCSSSMSDSRGSAIVVRKALSSRTEKIDMKGKGVFSPRPRSRLCQRKGGGSQGKNSSIFSYDPPIHDEVIYEQPDHHFSTNKRANFFIGDDSPRVDNTGNHNLESPKKLRARLRTLSRGEVSLSSDEDMLMKKSTLFSEELQDDLHGIQGCGRDENSEIKLLEQALERARAARVALSIDLEEERSAAASAAGEAMAMIFRLQEEKASVEMEARQYKRMIEEKSAYNDEEMDILEEILVRREKEKHFLEKEVEAYRLMVTGGNEQFTRDFSNNDDAKQIFGHLNDPDDDPVLILNQLAASTKKNVTTENKDIQSTPEDPLECEKSIPCHRKDLEQVQETNQGPKLSEKAIGTCHGTEKGDLNLVPSLKQQEKDAPLRYKSSCDKILDKDPPHVYDVHIIGDGINFCSEATEDKGEKLPRGSSLKVRGKESGAARERINVVTDSPSSCHLEAEAVAKKNCLEITSCIATIGRRGLSHGPRQSSTSSMDTEMLKIDTEINQLREHLKLVQEERGKHDFSLEYGKRNNSQLRILEDIAQHIQEIQRLTGSEKAAQQAYFLLPNSKGLSTKRRSRSVSSR